MKEQTQEIQKNFEDAIDKWCDIMLNFEVRTQEAKILPDQYSDETLMNITHLFAHVLSNIAISKRKIADVEAALKLGTELHKLIKEYTDFDTKEFYKRININPN